jgi:putative transposase
MTARKPLPVDLIDALLAVYKKPEDLIGEEGLLKQLTKALVERAKKGTPMSANESPMR